MAPKPLHGQTKYFRTFPYSMSAEIMRPMVETWMMYGEILDKPARRHSVNFTNEITCGRLGYLLKNCLTDTNFKRIVSVLAN